MLTYAVRMDNAAVDARIQHDVCSRMLTYAHVCSRMLTYAVRMDNAAVDARIQQRKEQRDREREREAIARLEALCGGGGGGGERESWGNVNPPGVSKAAGSDSDSVRMLTYADVC